MGVICDNCKKKIMYGDINRIELTLFGKFGKIARKIMGDDKLVFCSITCFEEYKFPEYKGEK